MSYPGYPGNPGYPQGPGGYPAPGGYPPPGQGYPMPGYPPNPGYPMPHDQPPPGYAYPPIPTPAIPPDHPIMSQPQPGQMPGPGPYNSYFPHPGPGYYPPGGPPGPPVQMQPQGFIGGHSIPVNVPPGLEYLTTVDQLFVKQKVEMLEALTGCETKNKYKIKNSQGQVIYTAKEQTDCCTRNLCGPYRPFDITIKDGQEREVIHLSRPLACDSCFCPCLLQSIEVFSPPGQLAGRVVQQWSVCSPVYTVQDAAGNTLLRIEGPFCTSSICGDVEFQILSKDGSTVVGKISKRWSGLLREAFTDADNFGLSFPIDLDVRMKAVMLGACFLIDFMFFEKQRNKEYDQPGMF